MESKEYFEKVMQDYNQNRKGRSLRKYCKDEAVDYDWLIQYKKNYPLQEKQQELLQDAFIPITIKEVAPKSTNLASGDLNSEISRRRADRDKE